MSGGDVDLVLCGRQFGLGFGRFPELRTTHLIPARRLTEDYIADLVRAIGCSNVLVRDLHQLPMRHTSRRKFEFLRSLLYRVRYGRRSFRFRRAELAGVRDGMRMLESETSSVAGDRG